VIFGTSLAEMAFTKMMFSKLSIVSVLFSLAVSLTIFLTGCQNGGVKPSNRFAQNQQTVPPPATFSSQESYLGQTPGGYVPQTPATTFPASGSVLPTQPTTTSPATTPSDTANVSDSQGATRFTTAETAEKESSLQPVEVAATNKTAFQVMDAKINTTSSNESGTAKTASGTSESLVVGTSHVVTTIVDESQLLYPGK
jgi:hypothetical protein